MSVIYIPTYNYLCLPKLTYTYLYVLVPIPNDALLRPDRAVAVEVERPVQPEDVGVIQLPEIIYCTIL